MKAFNFSTMTYYAGSNAALAGNSREGLPAFASFNQLRDMGYMVNKGAKSVSIFCGYRQSKKNEDGKSVPCWGRVFDIVDTTAYQDKQFMAWLLDEVEAGRIAPSALQVNQEIGAALFGGARGAEAVRAAYAL
jgi:hypothetical protein